MKYRVVAEWKKGPISGRIEASHARLPKARILKGRGKVNRDAFTFSSAGSCRLELTFDAPRLGPGPESPLVTLRTPENPFSFFLRDVDRRRPILIPRYGVVVTEVDDTRSYARIEREVRRLGLRTKLQQIEREPEETFESAAAQTRNLQCPTWLGLSRDMRIFEVGVEHEAERWFYVQPRFHGHPVRLAEAQDNVVRYNFFMGRGIGCVRDITRRLEDGALPILHVRSADEDIVYNCTAFATLERSRLTVRMLRGTHFLVADGYGYGCQFTQEQARLRESLLPKEMNRSEETVLWCRVDAVNTSPVPRYAWFKAPEAMVGNGWPQGATARGYDPKTGFAFIVSVAESHFSATG